jgi:hypothetical protein
MFTILVVAPEEATLETLARARPSVEILRARGPEEALEKLDRNRRIDAVLFLGPGAARAIAEIRADNPAPPPLFATGLVDAFPPEVRLLPAGPAEAVLDRLIKHL